MNFLLGSGVLQNFMPQTIRSQGFTKLCFASCANISNTNMDWCWKFMARQI